MLKRKELRNLNFLTRHGRVWIILVSLVFWSITPFAADAQETKESIMIAPPASPLVIENEPCSLPAPGSMTLSSGELGVLLQGQGQAGEFAGSSQLKITCLRFNQSHYAEGDTWSASIVVTNIGNANSDVFSIYGYLCRFPALGGSLGCQDDFGSYIPLGGQQAILEPGESRLIVDGPNEFIPPLPLDEDPSYESWIDGIPDNGVVFLLARLSGVSQQTVAQAIYPSAPENPAAGDPGFIDEDGDGWSPPEDCDDQNPDIHPGASEILGDGQTNDCEGGDVGLGACGEETISYRNTCLPIGIMDLGSADLDGDGVSADEGDCDDNDPWTHPFAAELNDSLDNNCNGLVDETFSIPDWIIEDYSVLRTTGEHTLASGNTILVPGLNYDLTIGNAGDYIGDDFSSIQAVGHYIPFYPTMPVGTGTSGFIPYTHIPGGYLWACTEQILSAIIADTGLYGEVNTTNNLETFWLPPISLDYLSLHFDQTPSLSLAGGPDTMLLFSHAAITGSCPDLPTSLDGGTDYIQIQRRLLGQNQELHEGTFVGLGYLPAISLPQTISNGDQFCLEIKLDPNHLVAENPDDNFYALVREYHNPIIGSAHFDLIDSYNGPGSGASFSNADCQTSEVTSSLTGSSTSPLLNLLGILVVGILGGGLGYGGGRAAGAAGRTLWGIVIAGLLIGGVLGYFVSGRVNGRFGPHPEAETVISAQPVLDEVSNLPACEDLTRSITTLPEDGAIITPFDTAPLTWQASFLSSGQIPDQVTIRVISPTGSEVLIQAELDPRGEANTYHSSRSIGAELYLHGINLFDEPGEYEWTVVNASKAAGDGARQFPICAGATSYSFQVSEQTEEFPSIPPTASPTATPIIPPSPTPTKPGPPKATKPGSTPPTPIPPTPIPPKPTWTPIPELP